MPYKLKTLVDDCGNAAKEDLLRALESLSFKVDGRIGAGVDAILNIDPLKYAYTGDDPDRYWSAVRSALIESQYSPEEASVFVRACMSLRDKYGDIVAQMIEDSLVPGAEIEIPEPPPELREYMNGDSLYMFTIDAGFYDREEVWEREEGVIENFQPKELILPAFVAPLYLVMFAVSLLGDSGGGDIFDTIVHHLKKTAREMNRAWRKTEKFIKKIFSW